MCCLCFFQIWAHIPCDKCQPELHKAVVKYMLHKKCGDRNPYAVCMVDGQCSKKFPHAYK